MSVILDYCVPGRRREKRRINALEERLHARWGDPSISAPVEGGWNQLSSVEEKDEVPTPLATPSFPPPGFAARDQRPATSAGITTMAGITESSQQVTEKSGIDEKHMATLTLTIPLPWHAPKKSHNRNSSLTNQTTSPSAQVVSGETGRADSQTTSPAVIFKPASESYQKSLDEMANVSSQTTSPTVLYKPASGEYKKALDNMVNSVSQSSTFQSLGNLDPDSIPPVPHAHLDRRESSGPIGTSDSERDKTDFEDTPNTSSTKSSPHLPSDTSTATSPTFLTTEEIMKSMAELGLSPNPALKDDRFRRSSSMGPAVRSNFRESISSSSSGESAGSLRSSRGLNNTTMASGGGYYSSLVEEYKQIARAVEEAAVAEYGRKRMVEARQRAPARAASVERVQTLKKDRTRGISADRRRGESVERIPDVSRPTRRRREESTERVSQAGRTADRRRAESVDKIPDAGRNKRMSIDRTLQDSIKQPSGKAVEPGERTRGMSIDRVRGMSKDRARDMSTDRTRRMSREVPDLGPQELVPKSAEIWG